MILSSLLLALTLVQVVANPGPYDLEFLEVTDSIYVAYRPDATRLPVHGNITIIINEHDVVVVDAGGAPASARQVIEHVRSLTPDPVSTLINTHGHEDHILGNQVFTEAYPGIEIIAREGTRAYLKGGRVTGRVEAFGNTLESRRATGASEIERLRRLKVPGDEAIMASLRRYYDQDLEVVAREYEHVRVTPPTATFETKLVLERPGRTIMLLNIGPGKAGSDVVVYLPVEKVLIAGDIVTHPIPYGFARDPMGWMDTLKQLDAFEFTLLIPGHGEVLRDKTYLRQVIALVAFEVDAVVRGVEQGLDEAAIRARTDFSTWLSSFTGGDPLLAYRFETWFIEPAISRAYQALSTGSGQ
jgi:glyoxylase-like metal-dependent hydrolase (beta-lactamase superfamily II)